MGWGWDGGYNTPSYYPHVFGRGCAQLSGVGGQATQSVLQTQAPLSDDYGPAVGCWSMGSAAAPADRLRDYEPAGAAVAAAESPAPQDLPRTTGRPGAADADADSAEAAVPSEGLRAGRRRQRTRRSTRPSCSGPTRPRDLVSSSLFALQVFALQGSS